MDKLDELIYDTKKLMMVRYPRFASEIAAAKISYRSDLGCPTAATDGKNIYFDPGYFESLNEEERLFVIAHELMHIKFKHAYRIKYPDGSMRNRKLWNIATDAVINANLEKDGFTIKEGYVNRPDAIDYSAEEFYEILEEEQEEKERKQQEQQNNSKQDKGDGDKSSQGQSGGESSNNTDNDEKPYDGDDHGLWEEVFKDKENDDAANDLESTDDIEIQDFDEKGEFEENRLEKAIIVRNMFDNMKGALITNSGISTDVQFGDVGNSEEIIDWKILLQRAVDEYETIWSQRRSIVENNYAYRLEEYDVEEESETEIVVDTSPSVSDDLLRNFLRECKNIIRNSRVKVGCFSDYFYGFHEINDVSDIDTMTFQRGRGTNFNAAVGAFTDNVRNKIIFTDGEASMPEKPMDVIWIVYGNKKINPPGGKVFYVDENQLKKLNDGQDVDEIIKIR